MCKVINWCKLWEEIIKNWSKKEYFIISVIIICKCNFNVSFCCKSDLIVLYDMCSCRFNFDVIDVIYYFFWLGCCFKII